MTRKTAIVLCSTLLLLTGCKHHKKPSDDASVSSEKPSEKTEETEKPTSEAETTASSETTKPSTSNNTNDAGQKAGTASVTGTYQIISYDDGSGKKQTFAKGKDSSIIGSSSVVLNQDGSCEFNLPGVSSNGCTWSGNQIRNGGATIGFSISGKDLTVSEDDGTYVFEKAQ